MAVFINSPMMAQNHIDKIVDELEQKGVDASKVVKRDPKTKKPYSIVKSLTFYSKDSNYANRLKEAFRKDAEDAIEEKVEKKGNSYKLIFVDGDVKEFNNLDGIMDFFGSGAIEIEGLKELKGDTLFFSNGKRKGWSISKSFVN